MAAKPYKITDRRAAYGYTNTLYEGASSNVQRVAPSDQYRDHDRLVTHTGRRQLVNYSRQLFANFPAVHGMLMEQANLAVSSFIPQFYGKDKVWGNQAEEWLYEWHRIMDIRGWPYDFDSYVTMLVLSPLRCGDIGTLLTAGAGDYPLVQVIPGHRIGSTMSGEKVVSGPYAGLRIIDGCIVDDYGRVQAYRVWQDSVGSSGFEDIPAKDLFLSFYPEWPDQCRGIPQIASGTNDWEDVAEWRRQELIAHKVASTQTLVESNETGDAPVGRALIKTAAVFGTDGSKTSEAYQEFAGGTIRYLRAGSGSDVKAFTYDRPGSNTQQFVEMCVRDAFRGAEWDMYFGLDPSKVGGASMRVIVEKVNRVIRKRQALVEKACRRVDGYAIAKAIKLGLLPANDEWWKWEYQTPAEVTADRKYDSDVDVQEYNAGFTTLKRICGRRNSYWEEVQDQWLDEQKRLQDKAKEKGVDLPAKGGNEAKDTIPNRTRREPDSGDDPNKNPDEEQQ